MTQWASAMRRCAWLSALFCVLILSGLGWNAFASRASDPNPPTRVDDLVTRINLDPGNKQLLSDLRRQDDWLRSSYFRSVRFAQTGFVLLIIGVGSFLLFAKGADKLRAKPIQPDPTAPQRAVEDALASQRVVLSLGLGLGGVLALVATLSRHDTVAAYVDGKPLPQVTPVAPDKPQGLPTASIAAAAQTPTAVAATPTAVPISGAIPLGGTSLTQLPISTTVQPSQPVKPTPTGSTTAKVALADASGWVSFRGSKAGNAPKWTGPNDWDVPSGKGVLWKADVPLPGWNSPIVSGGKVFLSGADDKKREICAYELTTGKMVWRLAIPVLAGTASVKPSSDAGYAPSTMTTDGKRVFAAFVDGNVVCVSTDGKPVWGRKFGPLDNSYGFASSLLMSGGKLIVQMDQGSSPEQGKSKLYGLDPATGNSVWETARAVSASWSSPIGVQFNGKPAIVVVAAPGIALYDAATGAQIWHAEGLSGEIAASPAFGDGRFYIGQQGSVLIAVSAQDGKVLWNTSDPALPDISSLAFAGGLVFLNTSDGTASAIDGATGKIVWEKRLEKPSRASPIVVGDCVYLVGTDGVLRVFRVGRTFALVGQHRLGEAAQATPAFDGGRMIVRGEHHLICIGAK